MAKDNFWKNPAVIRALLMLSDRDRDDDAAEDEFYTGELLSSEDTRKMLKASGVKYPSQLNKDLLEKANKGWWGKVFDYFTPAGLTPGLTPIPMRESLGKSYRFLSNVYGTEDSFRNRLIGMTQKDPRLNEIIFNEDGTINEANLNRITRIAKAKLGNDSIFDPFVDNPAYYYISPDMSEDEAGFRAEKAEDYLGDALNGNINRSGELLALNDRVNREYSNRAKQQDILKAARAGSLANNDVEATIGGDPVSVLPSYVQASYEKTPEDELEEELFKRRAEDEEWGQRLEDLMNKRFDESKKGTDWWWL